MKELICIDAKDSDLVENEIYHLEDVIACDICEQTLYVLFESKPLDKDGLDWFCFKCKQRIENPSDKPPYSPHRFVELNDMHIEELVDIIENKVPVVNSKIIINLPPRLMRK